MAIAISQSLWSQTQPVLERDSFVILKEFVPSLSQAARINTEPVIGDTDRLAVEPAYSFLERKVTSVYSPELIKAAVLKGEPLIKLRRHYLILGYGNNSTPLAEYYFSQLRSKKVSYSFSGRHLSSAGISDIENSSYSHNTARLTGSYIGRKFTTECRLNYAYDHVNMYGFDNEIPGLNLEAASKNLDVMQFYNRFSASAGLRSNMADTMGLKHATEMTYSHLNERYGVSENRFLIGEELSFQQSKEVYLASWAIDYNKYFSDADRILTDSVYETTLITVGGGIALGGEKWHLTGKLNLVGDFSRKTRLHVYPQAEFSYNLVSTFVIPYAGVGGRMVRNTFAAFSGENPFVNPLLHLVNTDEKITLYGGVKGNLSSNTSFDLSASQSSVSDMPLYIKDSNSLELRSFAVVYDEILLTSMKAELFYKPAQRWDLMLSGTYFLYETKDQLEAWHKPDYHIAFTLGYSIGEKILVSLQNYIIGKQMAWDHYKKQAESLAGTANINLDFEYRYNKKTSLFLDLNNLTSQAYLKWQDYPTQRLNFIAGLKLSF